MDAIKEEDLKIICSDATEIAATLFTPQKNTKAAIMIAPATGIKRQFYSAFANYLAQNEYSVITFDNRGIGESLQGHVKNCNASLQEWGELDMTAVLEELKKRFPDSHYHLIGHSAGGQLVGLMSNSQEIRSMFNFACSSGRTANMKFPFLLQAVFFMYIFIPINNLCFGYTNTQWMGMGEPLPKNVARQWKEWCNGKGYVKTAFGKSIKEHWYDSLDFPSLWLNAADDNIAINENVSDMISVFTKLPSETQTIEAQDFGLKEIGHMKFFSRKNKVLWKLALDWLNKNP